MRDFWEKAASAVLGLAAVAMAVALVHREFFPTKNQGQVRKSAFVADWRNILPAGRLSGSPVAPITIVEFTDLQCPFCRRFNAALRAARKKFPEEVSVVVVHFPLSGHAQAQPAARAVECADASGKFFETLDFIFEAQDSLGRKPWTWFANGSGIRDTLRFAHCMADTTARSMVTAGLAMGRRFDLVGTPLVLLNGWRYGVAPSDTELVRAIGDLLGGRKPYKDFPTSALGVRAQ